LGVLLKDTLKLQNFWATKALISPYIRCRSLSFTTRITPKVFHIYRSNFLEHLIERGPEAFTAVLRKVVLQERCRKVLWVMVAFGCLIKAQDVSV